MKCETFQYSGYQGAVLPARLWLPDGDAKLVLQITHGMTEHMARYESLAASLTALGIAVAGFDLRGHGENPGDATIATFGEGGWDASIEDMRLFFELLGNRFSGVPHVMLGFSLGSFLLREYLGRYPEGVSGAIIMGTGHQPGAVLSLIMAIVKGQIKKGGFDGTTELVQQLSFGTYNQKCRPNRTPADWLCADEAQLDAYLADPLCRQQISAGLFWQMLGAMKRTCRRDACEHWNKDLPILLLSGQDDPVGDAGKGVIRVKAAMERAGITQVDMHLLPQARHDLLHEEACGAAAQATEIISRWLLAKIRK